MKNGLCKYLEMVKFCAPNFGKLPKEVNPLPKLASSKKRMRQAEKIRLRNRGTRSSLRTSIKRMLATNSKEEAEALINRTQSIIDKTAQKGVIHRNAAARYKSRVRRHVAALEA